MNHNAFKDLKRLPLISLITQIKEDEGKKSR